MRPAKSTMYSRSWCKSTAMARGRKNSPGAKPAPPPVNSRPPPAPPAAAADSESKNCQQEGAQFVSRECGFNSHWRAPTETAAACEVLLPRSSYHYDSSPGTARLRTPTEVFGEEAGAFMVTRFGVGLLLLLGACAAPAHAQVNLSWKFEKGEEFYTEDVQRSKLEWNGPGVNQRIDLDFTTLTKTKVLEKNPDGSIV